MAGASLLVLLAAGCQAGAGGASPQPAGSSAVVRPSAVAWQRFTDGCPTLTAPPYGVGAKGKRYPPYVAPGDQTVLDRVVPGASFDQAYCSYKIAGSDLPIVSADVRIFRGANGASQVDTLFQSENAAAKRLAGPDYADVPQLGDGAFATFYFETHLQLTARSSNAYIRVAVSLDPETVKSFDVLQPLPPQVPALSAVMTDVLAELR